MGMKGHIRTCPRELRTARAMFSRKDSIPRMCSPQCRGTPTPFPRPAPLHSSEVLTDKARVGVMLLSALAENIALSLLQMAFLTRGGSASRMKGDFPGDPVAKSSHFHCGGCGFNAWLGNKDPACQTVWPKNNSNHC